MLSQSFDPILNSNGGLIGFRGHGRSTIVDTECLFCNEVILF